MVSSWQKTQTSPASQSADMLWFKMNDPETRRPFMRLLREPVEVVGDGDGAVDYVGVISDDEPLII